MLFRPTRVNLSNSSSRAWLARQFRDPYVRERASNSAGYRSRSAFKLLEVDAKYGGFLAHKDVQTVVDLGAAPGGWSQVVARKLGWMEDCPAPSSDSDRVVKNGFKVRGNSGKAKSNRRSTTSSMDTQRTDDESSAEHPPSVVRDEQLIRNGRGKVIAVDLLPIMPIPGVHTLAVDFLAPQSTSLIHNLLISEHNPDGKADIILSDMAANFSGNRIRDVESSLDISESVFLFATQHLRTAASQGRKYGGVLLLKHFAHPLLHQFRLENLEPNFHVVKYIKPDSSRAASSEGYWLCQGWKGLSSASPATLLHGD